VVEAGNSPGVESPGRKHGQLAGLSAHCTGFASVRARDAVQHRFAGALDAGVAWEQQHRFASHARAAAAGRIDSPAQRPVLRPSSGQTKRTRSSSAGTRFAITEILGRSLPLA
jgi:hypothetical protein